MKRERRKVVMFEKNYNVRIGLSYCFEPELNKTKKKKMKKKIKQQKKCRPKNSYHVKAHPN